MRSFELAQYRLIRRVGEGATGEVYLAETGPPKRPESVALKIYSPFLSSVPAFVDRARETFRRLARLRHPNLPHVRDFGVTPAGRVALVTDWLDGSPLCRVLAGRGPLPVAEAVAPVRAALAGLHAAHGAGLVHRNVTLASVVVSRAGLGATKVVDFGVAKILGHTVGSARGVPIELDFPLDESRALSGRCLSPEQVLGRPADARTDVYGAGAVLYALLAGRGPFDHADGPLAIAEAHAFEEPLAVSRWRPRRIPEDLERILFRALAKRPSDRFSSAAAFSTALARFASHPAARTTAFREPCVSALQPAPA